MGNSLLTASGVVWSWACEQEMVPKHRGKKFFTPSCLWVDLPNQSVISICQTFLGRKFGIYVDIHIWSCLYAHIYVCIHINIHNPDCIKANFVGGAKEETRPSLMLHNPHCREGFEVFWVHSVWGQWYNPLLSVSNRWREWIIHWFQLRIHSLTSIFCCASGANTIGRGRNGKNAG